MNRNPIGTVYGVILNDAASLQSLGDALEAAPYKGAPKAPVLYIKPANTHAANGATVSLPAGAESVEVGATLGLVMARSVSHLSEVYAMDAVGGVMLVADLSLPHTSYYRPAIREKCFDGACPMGAVESAASLANLADCVLTTEIDGQQVDRRSLADLLRQPARLLADVTDFMSLSRGDVLLLGVRYMAPQAKVGSRVRISAPGLQPLEFSIAAAQGAQ